ncbi:MAG TPA: glycine zipper 2TM domain-containing protein [Marinagarivorans sp.]
MNKQMIVGVLLGTAIATAGGAYAVHSSAPKVASVVSVTPITVAMNQQYASVTQVQLHSEPGAPRLASVVSSRPIIVAGRVREVCEDQLVTHQAPVQDQNQIAGTAAGAVIGGLLGNQVGGGDGKKVATAIGAIAGGVIGKNTQARHQQQQTYQTSETVCRDEREPDRTTGYDVTVSVDGQPQQLTLSYAPGDSLPVVDGELITNAKHAQQIIANMPPPLYNVSYRVGEQLGQATLDYAPEVGTEIPYEYGQLLTKPEQLANLKARENTVVAYNVMYQTDEGISEARMAQHPTGDTIKLKRGKPVEQ